MGKDTNRHLINNFINCSYNLVQWEDISWRHLEQLYKEDTSSSGSGLRRVPKLKYEHVYLTSYSKMWVDLAAQVNTYDL